MITEEAVERRKVEMGIEYYQGTLIKAKNLKREKNFL